MNKLIMFLAVITALFFGVIALHCPCINGNGCKNICCNQVDDKCCHCCHCYCSDGDQKKCCKSEQCNDQEMDK